jgi:hypothetical protein
VRTVITLLRPEAQEELRVLDRRRAQIARRYIRRLALESYLGARVERGLLGEYGCRRIHFDRHDRPDDLFGASRPAKRRGDQDLSEGPGWRIVYWLLEAPRSQIRLVVILAVAAGHPRPRELNVYELARRRLEVLIGTRRTKEGRRERLSHQRGGVPSDHVRRRSPSPAEALTLSEVREQQARVLQMLEQGGAIIVYSDDHQHLFGVLTRDRRLLDEVSIAAMIDTGHLPPLAELIAMDDRSELP